MPCDLIVECAHCHTEFPHARRPGRRRLYCRRSCRQRAYEHRSRMAPTPRPYPYDHPTTNDGRRTPPLSFPEGHTQFMGGKHHAVIIGPPDGKHRFPTLCGLNAHPGIRPFSNVRPESCKTCTRLALVRPPTNPHRPQFELLAIRHHLSQSVNALRNAQCTGGDSNPRVLLEILHRALQPVR